MTTQRFIRFFLCTERRGRDHWTVSRTEETLTALDRWLRQRRVNSPYGITGDMLADYLTCIRLEYPREYDFVSRTLWRWITFLIEERALVTPPLEPRQFLPQEEAA